MISLIISISYLYQVSVIKLLKDILRTGGLAYKKEPVQIQTPFIKSHDGVLLYNQDAFPGLRSSGDLLKGLHGRGYF